MFSHQKWLCDISWAHQNWRFHLHLWQWDHVSLRHAYWVGWRSLETPQHQHFAFCILWTARIPLKGETLFRGTACSFRGMSKSSFSKLSLASAKSWKLQNLTGFGVQFVNRHLPSYHILSHVFCWFPVFLLCPFWWELFIGLMGHPEWFQQKSNQRLSNSSIWQSAYIYMLSVTFGFQIARRSGLGWHLRLWAAAANHSRSSARFLTDLTQHFAAAWHGNVSKRSKPKPRYPSEHKDNPNTW